MTRERLPNRRETENITFEHAGLRYTASASRFDDGRLAELFVNTNGKSGSEADINASDCAVAISLALQHGCSSDVLRLALKRNANGTAQGPVARALDLFSKKKRIQDENAG